MSEIVKIAQIVLSLLMIVLVMVQNKGKGLSSTFGGISGTYTTRRGLEKSIFMATIVVSTLLVINSLLIIYFS